MSLRSSFSVRAVALTFAAGAFFGVTATAFTATMLGSSVFADVPAGSYYDAAAGRMQAAGIMKGTDGNFNPGNFVTRAELVTVIDRVINGADAPPPSPPPPPPAETARSSSSRSSAVSSRAASSAAPAKAGEAGSVHFTTGAFSISDKAGTLIVSVIRSGGTKGAVTVNYDFSGGTGVATTNYNPATGTISFKEGETSKTISLRVLVSGKPGPASTVNLTLSAPTGGVVLGSPSSAVVTIINSSSSSTTQSTSSAYSAVSSAPGGTFALSGLGYAAEEKIGSITVTVKRTGTTSAAAAVEYATADGVAKAGKNYGATTGTLSFAAGESSRTFTIPLVNNNDIDGNQSFSVSLKNATGGANIGYPSTATVTVIDDEVISSGSGSLQFSTDTYVVSSSENTATIIVNRISGTTGSVSVSYTTNDGSAIAGSDYTATSGQLTFGPGESSKYFIVPIINHKISQDELLLNLVLSSPTGGASMGVRPTAALKIRK